MGKDALRKTAVAVVLTLIAVFASMPSSADASDRSRAKAISYAKAQLGKPYIWGATGPRGYDCSGLIYAAYKSVGRTLPRTTYGMLGLKRGSKRPGDLVFSGRGHMALYIGNGRVIVAPRTGAVIRYESSARYTYAVRSPY